MASKSRSAAAKKAWATRRKLYGKSGIAKGRAATDKKEGVTKSGAKAGWGSTRGLAAKMRSGNHPNSNAKRRKKRI